jgi:spore coat polysaccharide biosynthesis protein SpsF
VVRRPGIILQARLRSTRLPGKALEPIGRWPVLEHCLRRLLASTGATVLLATTKRPEDDALAAVAARLGTAVFRGSAHDVLGRFATAAVRFGFDPVIRATADNPGVDIDAPARVLAALERTGADYVQEPGLPVGGAVEGVTAAALLRASKTAASTYDREHVTTYIKSHPQEFRIVSAEVPAHLRRPDVRLTVDTTDDLDYVRMLFDRAGSELPSIEQLITAAGSGADREVA